EPLRRYQELGRPPRRLDHGRAVPRSFRQRRSLGAPRHRSRGARLAADRDERRLGVGLRCHAARPAGARQLRAHMTEILFYHLEAQPLERVLPLLIEKSLERGWRVVVETGSEERAEAIDN